MADDIAALSAPILGRQSIERIPIAIIGAGFSGLGMAAKLKAAGRGDFIVLEKAAEVGGTWRENTYPGCACDVPSHLYSFSFATNPNWSRMYPTQDEIWRYLIDFTDQQDLRAACRFGFQATNLDWVEDADLWRITSADGRVVEANVVVSGMGGLHIPNRPNLPGLSDFRGQVFHSAEWEHSVKLSGARVAVIGSGASAVQFVPQIAPQVAQLDLYQRTPNWILPKGDRRMSGLEQAMFRALPPVQGLYRALIYWLNEVRAIAFQRPDIIRQSERQALAHLHAQIADPALRAQLTPSYTIGCKRVLISNDFYPALIRPNVALITDPIARITPNGVLDSAGVERAADVLILATGFKPMDLITGVAVTGRDGRKLNEEWAELPEAFLGSCAAGYPNLYFLMGPNTGLGHNSMIYMIESQIAFVLDALAVMDREGLASLEVRPDAQRDFNAELVEKLKTTVWASGCKSWYLSADGRNPTIWPGFTFDYRKRTRRIPREAFVTRRAGIG